MKYFKDLKEGDIIYNLVPDNIIIQSVVLGDAEKVTNELKKMV